MPVPENIVIKQLDLEINGGFNYAGPPLPPAHRPEKDFVQKLPFLVFEKILIDAARYGLDTVSLHGSGEPTLNRDMPKYVARVKSMGVRCMSFSNALRLDETMARGLIEVGLDVLRISAIGYD